MNVFGDTGGTMVMSSVVKGFQFLDGRLRPRLLDHVDYAPAVQGREGLFLREVDALLSAGDRRVEPQDDSSEALPLYENTLPNPVHADVYETEDRLWGPMVGCDGGIYAQTATARYLDPQHLWRYDIEAGIWSRHALPESYGAEGVNPSGLVAYHDELYLYGPYTEDGELSDGCRLWHYDSSGDAWEQVNLDVPAGSSLCVLGDDLLFVGGYYDMLPDGGEGVCCAKVDLAKRELAPIGGDDARIAYGGQRRVVASREKLYVYAWQEDEAGVLTPEFYRLTYDAQGNTMSVEDMTEAFEAVAPLRMATRGGPARAVARRRRSPSLPRAMSPPPRRRSPSTSTVDDGQSGVTDDELASISGGWGCPNHEIVGGT